MRLRTLSIAGIASVLLAVVAVVGSSSCVGDATVTSLPDGGTDSSIPVDATASDSAPADSGDAGCAKMCDGGCASIDDPAFGCTATSCSACPPLAHTLTQKCSGGTCVVGGCDPAFDDLNKDAGDGCEMANPLAFQPSSLAVWLKGDKGVAAGSDGGVTSWASQVGDGGAALASGAPVVDTSSWPSIPGASTVKFASGDSFDLDLSAMMSSTGYTTFIASSRYGDVANCVLGSHTYPSGSPSCCAQAGQAFELCYLNNTQLSDEVYCNSMITAVTANTSSGYQPGLVTMWFDPSGPLNHFTIDGTPHDDTGQCPHALLNLAAPARLGGSASGPAYTGLIGEVVVYSTLLSVPDRTAVQTYLKTKWKTP